jgi:hypothetical protein
MEHRIVGRTTRLVKVAGLVALAAGTASGPIVSAESNAAPAGQQHVTTAPAYWNWDPATPAGSSMLVRTEAGLSFTYSASSLPAGQVVTVWIVVFNNPENCSTSPCSMPADVFNPDTHADFLYGGGHVPGQAAVATSAVT